MTALLLRIMGVDDRITSQVDQVQLLWAREAMLWVGLALLVPLAVGIVWRQRRNLPHVAMPARWTLNLCRIGVLLLLVLVLAGPYLRLEQMEERRALLAVVVDASASMSLPAGPFEDGELEAMAAATGRVEAGDGERENVRIRPEDRRELNSAARAEVVRQALANTRADVWDELAERFDLRFYVLDATLREATIEQLTAERDEVEREPATAIGSAIGDILTEAAAREVAGVVLITDGQSTTGPAPSFVARQRGIIHTGEGKPPAPMWTIPVGSRKPAMDVVVLEAIAPGEVARGDQIAVMGVIGSHGAAGEQVAVTLHDGETELAKQTTVLRDGGRVNVELPFEAKQTGVRHLSLRVAPMDGETVTQNNALSLQVTVSVEPMRILYLEGYPRWDFRFLDHALRRDGGLAVTMVLEAPLEASDAAPSEFPTIAKLPQDVAGFTEYAAVILGDISPRLLPPRLQRHLATAIAEEGVGLLVQAGPQRMPHLFRGQPLANLLPTRQVAAASGGEGELGGEMAEAFAPFRMEVTAPGAMHPALRLYDAAGRNRDIWSRMPAFHWAASLEEPRPGALVLAEYKAAGQVRPLIVEHFAGRGRVMLIGMDSTFLWRRNIGSHLFHRFWGQAIRHVARPAGRGDDRSWLEAQPTSAPPGEPIALHAYVADEAGDPIRAESLQGQVTVDDRFETVTLNAVGHSGHFRGRFTPDVEGRHEIRLTTPAGDTLDAVVTIASPNREFRDPTVDRQMLGTLAQSTGGDLLELHELPDLSARLTGQPVMAQTTLQAELWDNWLTLVLLISLYCLDVGVRRFLGLT